MRHVPQALWNPYVAGALLGLGLLLTFVMTGHGLGASGFSTSLAASAAHTVAPAAVESSDYFGVMFEDDSNPLDAWITWQMIGVMIGALVGAVTAGRFAFNIDGPNLLRRSRRLLLAVGGGIVAGIGARVALGCTSGLGLSGSATLATAGFLFLIGFFVAGAAFGQVMKRFYS